MIDCARFLDVFPVLVDSSDTRVDLVTILELFAKSDCLFSWTSGSDDHKDNHDHEESDHKIKLHSLDEEAENMIKKVKHAMANGEGCRVWFHPI